MNTNENDDSEDEILMFEDNYSLLIYNHVPVINIKLPHINFKQPNFKQSDR